MADFNQILTPGDVDAGIINVVNEIPEVATKSNGTVKLQRSN